MAKRHQKPPDVIKARAEPVPAWMPDPEEEEQAEEQAEEKATPFGGRRRGSTNEHVLWHKAIVALMLFPDVKAAAESIGVHVSTLYGWMRDPEFIRQSTEIRREGTTQVVRSIFGQAGKSIQTVIDIRDDPTTNPVVRLSAVKLLLDLWSKWAIQEHTEDLATEHIKKLERMNAELMENENARFESIGSAAPLALTDGNGGAPQGTGEGDDPAPGGGESAENDGV